jgi:hypothetical protein
MTALSIFRYDGADVRTLTRDGEPPLAGVEKHVYAIEIVGVGVKVGITEFPGRRVQAHARAARAHGATIGRVVFTEAHENARDNEATLKRLGGERNRSEYIQVSFDRVLDAIKNLPIRRADAAAHEQKQAAFLGFMRSVVEGGIR